MRVLSEKYRKLFLLQNFQDQMQQRTAALQQVRGVQQGVTVIIGRYIDWVVQNPDFARFLFMARRALGTEQNAAVAVQNQQGKTRLEIATVPLDSGARPTLGEPSRGRIYADVNGFLDPVDFRGQLVTVVGPITGTVDGKIGNTPYKFMVMQVTGYKRWHLTQQVIMPPQPIDPWFYGGRGWPYGYGGWGWYNPGPARVQTVVTE